MYKKIYLWKFIFYLGKQIKIANQVFFHPYGHCRSAAPRCWNLKYAVEAV